MFDRFTDRAKKVMSLARQASQQFSHEYVGTEHLLLGLIQEGSGVAANVLKNLRVDLESVRREIQTIVKHGPAPVTVDMVPFTPRAKRVFELATEEAGRLSHHYLGTEHLLLGLIRENEGIAHHVLINHGVKLEEARAEVLEYLGAGDREHREPGEPGADLHRSAQHFERRLLEKLVAPVAIEIQRGHAYVVLGRDARSEQIYREAIVPALAKLGLEVVRGDDVDAPGTQLAQVWRHLCTAELVLIVPRRDANLSYLLGFCHGASRCPILLVESSEELPSCMRTLPWIDYGADPAEPARLALELERHLRSLRQVRDSDHPM